MSPNPPVLDASMGMYKALMFGPSPLSRSQREMLGTVVSRINDCFYWTEAHAEDFRSEVAKERGGDAAAASVARALADALRQDWRLAALSSADQALCTWAEKLTLTPASCGAADVEALRAHGLTDVAIHDAAQVIGYFNYINRVADGLGVDLEPEMKSP
jgi:uncharacterized peroxidase-related enzyme